MRGLREIGGVLWEGSLFDGVLWRFEIGMLLVSKAMQYLAAGLIHKKQ